METDCWRSSLAALHQAWQADGELTWFELLWFVPMLAIFVAVVFSPWLRRAYSRRVRRFMGMREIEPLPAAWRERGAQRLGRSRAPTEESLPLADCMRMRDQRIRVATLAAWAALMIISLFVVPFMEESDQGSFYGMLILAGLLGLGPVLVNLRPEGSKAMLLLLIAVASAAWLISEDYLEGESWFLGVALVILLYASSIHRTMRATTVPLAILCAGLLLGLACAMLVLAGISDCVGDRTELQMSDVPELGLALTLVVAALVLPLWLGVRVMEGLGRIIRRGWLSDISLPAAAGAVIVISFLVLAADSLEDDPLAQAVLWLGWVALVAGTYACVLHWRPCPAKGRTLLVLRVFSQDRQAERLLDTLQARWQLAGPVLEIGGPDLVLLNLDTEEFIHFASFRLHELFQPASASQALLERSLDLGLDREGRFRVSELFCFDTSWKQVVEQLIGLADAVLLDLRGFIPERTGTAHELRRLAERGVLSRVVAIRDKGTD